MAGEDPETWLAYYCFVNRGWTPGQFNELPYREKILVKEFIHHEVKARQEEARKARSKRKR